MSRSSPFAFQEYETRMLNTPHARAKEGAGSCEIRYVVVATTVFHKLKYKTEWWYVTNNDSLFVTYDGDKESKTHILEGAGIISLNETCRGYANRDVLIPGRLSSKIKYIDFVSTSIMRSRGKEIIRFTKTMEAHHIRTNRMSDLQDRTCSQNEILIRIQQKEKYTQSKRKICICLISGGVAIISVMVANAAKFWTIKQKMKKRVQQSCNMACSFIMEKKNVWTTFEATAPSEEVPKISTTGNGREQLPTVYPELKCIQ